MRGPTDLAQRKPHWSHCTFSSATCKLPGPAVAWNWMGCINPSYKGTERPVPLPPEPWCRHLAAWNFWLEPRVRGIRAPLSRPRLMNAELETTPCLRRRLKSDLPVAAAGTTSPPALAGKTSKTLASRCGAPPHPHSPPVQRIASCQLRCACSAQLDVAPSRPRSLWLTEPALLPRLTRFPDQCAYGMPRRMPVPAPLGRLRTAESLLRRDPSRLLVPLGRLAG